MAVREQVDILFIKMFPKRGLGRGPMRGSKRSPKQNHHRGHKRGYKGGYARVCYGQGFLVIPEAHVPEFKKLLVEYYEGEEPKQISGFLKKKCWKTF